MLVNDEQNIVLNLKLVVDSLSFEGMRTDKVYVPRMDHVAGAKPCSCLERVSLY